MVANTPVLCLMGPTAAGKTALALELAERYPIEIISVDSGMIYRGLDIGTAKPSIEEQRAAPHHLIDVINPPESFSAAEFCSKATALIDSIADAGKIPLLVGGTMMYFNVLQKGLSILPEANEDIRNQLIDKAAQLGWAALHAELMQVDLISATKIHPHDTQRIQRALEVYYLTNQPLSSFKTITPNSTPFVNLILFPEQRSWLHERIAERFRMMLAQGFVEEVEALLKQWPLSESSPAMRCVGYRQAYQYLRGECDAAAFYERGVAATRQLAKRQLTWLRHWSTGHFIACDTISGTQKFMAIIQEILDNPHQCR